MHLRSIPIVALTYVSLIGCEAPPGSKPGGIISGVLDLGDPAVVALLQDDQAFCTGTVIGPSLVITAAHCVVMEGAIVGPTALYFGTETGGGDGETIEVAWTEPFPQYGQRSFFGDAALIGLASPTNVIPIPIRRASIDPEIGTSMRFVGFGFDEVGATGGHGTKLEGAAPLDSVDPEFLIYGQVTCAGDSGGPAFMINDEGVEELVGLTSHGPRLCSEFGNSFSTRVDAIAGWIDERIDVTTASCELDRRCVASCANDPDCTCVSDGRCDQCPDRADPDCSLAAVGDQCDGPGSCTPGAFCVDGLCGRACAPDANICSLDEACGSGVGEPRLVCLQAPAPPTTGCAASLTPGAAVPGLLLLALLALRRRRR